MGNQRLPNRREHESSDLKKPSKYEQQRADVSSNLINCMLFTSQRLVKRILRTYSRYQVDKRMICDVESTVTVGKQPNRVRIYKPKKWKIRTKFYVRFFVRVSHRAWHFSYRFNHASGKGIKRYTREKKGDTLSFSS